MSMALMSFCDQKKWSNVVANCQIKGFKLAWHHIDTSIGINSSEQLFNLSNDTKLSYLSIIFSFSFVFFGKNHFEDHAFNNYVILFHFRFDEAIFANGPTMPWYTLPHLTMKNDYMRNQLRKCIGFLSLEMLKLKKVYFDCLRLSNIKLYQKLVWWFFIVNKPIFSSQIK